MRTFVISVLVAATAAVVLAGGALSATGDSADVGVKVSADKTSYKVGDLVTYTVTITNAGESAADGVQLTALLPAGIDLVSTSVAGRSPDTVSFRSSSVGGGAIDLYSVAAQIDPTSDQAQEARIAVGAQFDLSYDVGTATGKTLVTGSLGWLGSSTYWSADDSTITVTLVGRATAAAANATTVVAVDSANPDPNVAANNYALSTVAVAT
jgi:uncharacterized repeat protein (TIGR01451 family)